MSKIFTLTSAKVLGHTLDTEPHATMQVEADSVSDGFHTMDELYEHRMALNIALFNMWHRHIGEDFVKVMKSRLHSDGTMFEGGYFIVMALTDHGQISYHYKLEHWNKFSIPEVERTPPYDGHSPEDVIKRLLKV